LKNLIFKKDFIAKQLMKYSRANFKRPAESFEIFFGTCRKSVFGGCIPSCRLKLLPPTARRFLSNLSVNDI